MGILGKCQTSACEIIFCKRCIGQRRVFQERIEVGKPAAFFKLALLNVIADMDDVEARATGSQLDHRLLALLLFRHLLGVHLDARQLFEFLLMLLKDFAARAFDEVYFKCGSGKFLPVDI